MLILRFLHQARQSTNHGVSAKSYANYFIEIFIQMDFTDYEYVTFHATAFGGCSFISNIWAIHQHQMEWDQNE